MAPLEAAERLAPRSTFHPPLEVPITVEVTDGSVPPPDSSGERAPRASEAIPTAARLQLLGKLASAIAHDFNNLLTVMLTCVDTAAAALPPTSPARGELEAAQAAGRQCARLVQQVLAKRPERTGAIADPNAVLTESAGLLGRVMGPHTTLRLEPGPAVWSVRATPDEIWQILFNLALNARDAMPADGTLVVSTRNASFAIPQPRPRLDAGDYAVLTVIDSGCGIDSQTQEHMFEPFFTTKGAGSGIGLATVARIVHKCGGAVRVESQPGHGSLFEVFLPRAAT